MSEPAEVSVVLAVLFALLPSLDAPVVPASANDPAAVGVPETVQVITALAAKLLTGVGGEHVVLRPAGKPLMAHVAVVAVTAGAAALVQV